MLTMDQINNIRYLLKYKGKSLRSISSETGHHFNTVKKYVEKENFSTRGTVLVVVPDFTSLCQPGGRFSWSIPISQAAAVVLNYSTRGTVLVVVPDFTI
jgi:hypothetical protein